MARSKLPAFENAAFFCFSPAAYHRLAGQMIYSFKTGDRLRSQRLQWIPRNLAFATRFAAHQACDAVHTHLECRTQRSANWAGDAGDEIAGGVHARDSCTSS